MMANLMIHTQASFRDPQGFQGYQFANSMTVVAKLFDRKEESIVGDSTGEDLTNQPRQMTSFP